MRSSGRVGQAPHGEHGLGLPELHLPASSARDHRRGPEEPSEAADRSSSIRVRPDVPAPPRLPTERDTGTVGAGACRRSSRSTPARWSFSTSMRIGGIPFEMHRSGLLLVATTPPRASPRTPTSSAASGRSASRRDRASSVRRRRTLEPELAGGLAGGARSSTDTSGPRAPSRASPATSRIRASKCGGDRGPGHGRLQRRYVRIATSWDRFEADRVVVAAGATSSPLDPAWRPHAARRRAGL